MKYSREIDGLRALSVVLVILFHSSEKFLPGGFIGVDVFFVISGFLITTIIKDEIDQTSRFSFLNFYNRRIARLLPSLNIVLFLVMAFGFLFYGIAEFDNLGKDIFYSAIGAKNIQDMAGVNYFVQDKAYNPLLHMWSLGIEEQYYVLWPSILLCVCLFVNAHRALISFALFMVFLLISEFGVKDSPSAAYFILWYRACELLAGSTLSLALDVAGKKQYPAAPSVVRSTLSILAISFLIAVSITYKADTTFPGFHALPILISTVCLIIFARDTLVGKFLSWRPIVLTGSISYPLYLLHQPIISCLLFFDNQLNPLLLFLVTFVTGSVIAFVIYVYVETPARRMAKTKHAKKLSVFLLMITLSLAGGGAIIAKTDGLPQRLSYINPFSYSLTQSMQPTFQQNFNRGIDLSTNKDARILFFGDSLLQQYVVPLSNHWGIDRAEIDVISRGGCVLLKGVEYKDKFSDISCDELRENLFGQLGNYEKIVFSQGWHLYGGKISNASEQPEIYGPQIWKPFIDNTIEHFQSQASQIYVIGPHPQIIQNCDFKIGPLTSQQYVTDCLAENLIDGLALNAASEQFRQAINHPSVIGLYPEEIWCHGSAKNCILHEKGMPYFYDRQHFGQSANQMILEKMQRANW